VGEAKLFFAVMSDSSRRLGVNLEGEKKGEERKGKRKEKYGDGAPRRRLTTLSSPLSRSIPALRYSEKKKKKKRKGKRGEKEKPCRGLSLSLR